MDTGEWFYGGYYEKLVVVGVPFWRKQR